MGSFQIISVTGAQSGVGKTSLCALLLSYLTNFGAIKYTKTDLYASVTDSPDIIKQNDKDTAILSAAGAERVVWIKSPLQELEHSLDIAMGKMGGLRGVIIEGNSPLGFVTPAVIIFVIGQDCQIKPSALPAIQSADLVVYNADRSNLLPLAVRQLLKRNASVFTMNMKEKTGEIDKFIAHVKKYVQ